MTRTFTKTGTNPLGEAAGLQWLAEAESDGGANVVPVLDVGPGRLELAWVHEARPTARAARAFGRSLAHTHAAGAGWWGCPPDGWEGPGHVGNSHTPLVVDPAEAPTTWGHFYADHRIDAFATRLLDDGVIDDRQAGVFHRLSERLRDGVLSSPQPALVRDAGHEVARVHGDMWAGNVLYDGSGKGATLIDPMAHGGHAETDLATLSVFGFPHLGDVYLGYDEASPLAEGWRDRIGLHQLGIVIMHAHLFRGSYTASALGLARRYL